VTASLDDALHHYGGLAARYDRSTRFINRTRQRAVAALQLQRSAVVLDAGCGTGYCFDFIQDAIGPTGKLIGFEPTPQMLTIAKQRVRDAGWQNVQLFQSRGEDALLPATADAVLFSYTHDMLQSRAALDNLFAQCNPGARVVSTGSKLFAPWLGIGNWWIRRRHQGYVTDFDSLAAPWGLLAAYLDDFQLEAAPLRQHYLASGLLKKRFAASGQRAAAAA
jgi:ubiquinone/menaquinone biosynthesis C-methylase UbiE